MNKVQLQGMIDLKKWYDSETHGRDMCGTYDFCAYCDKSVSLPCANAYEKANVSVSEKPVHKKKTTVKEIKEQNTSLGKKFDYDKVMAKKANRKSLTFAEKYALSSDVLKDR